MNQEIMSQLANASGYLSVALGAVGSALGCGIAGMAAIGAWKKRYAQNKQAPFLLMVLAGAPLSQTIYAMVLMVLIKGKVAEANAPCMMYALMGLFAGIGFLASALLQGKAGACAADAFGETDKGFANYLMILGIVETVALFTLVFGIMML
jgi:V/A-type H+-transporting ATPase subunit K